MAICRASCWLTDVNVFGGFMAGIAFDLQDISVPRIGYQPNAAGRLASVEIPRRAFLFSPSPRAIRGQGRRDAPQLLHKVGFAAGGLTDPRRRSLVLLG